MEGIYSKVMSSASVRGLKLYARLSSDTRDSMGLIGVDFVPTTGSHAIMYRTFERRNRSLKSVALSGGATHMIFPEDAAKHPPGLRLR